MEIQINHEYWLRSDERNLILARKRIIQTGKTAGEESWENLGYYRTFSGFCKGAFDSLIRASEAKSLVELEKDVRGAVTALKTVWEDLDERIKKMEAEKSNENL